MPRSSSENSRSIRRAGLGAWVLVALVALAGCGEAEHPPRSVDIPARDRASLKSIVGEVPTHRVSVTVAEGEQGFVERAAIAAAGRISFTLRNPTGADHNIAVLDASKPSSKGPPSFLGLTAILPSTSSFRHVVGAPVPTGTTVLDLKPGKYRIVCLVLDHAVQGMSIPLEVVDAPQATDKPLPDSAQVLARHLPANSATIARPSPAPAYDKREVTVKAGRVGFRFVNRSPVPSNVSVVAADGTVLSPDAPAIGPGTAGFVLDLTPGAYKLTNLLDPTRMSIPLHVR